MRGSMPGSPLDVMSCSCSHLIFCDSLASLDNPRLLKLYGLSLATTQRIGSWWRLANSSDLTIMASYFGTLFASTYKASTKGSCLERGSSDRMILHRRFRSVEQISHSRFCISVQWAPRDRMQCHCSDCNNAHAALPQGTGSSSDNHEPTCCVGKPERNLYCSSHKAPIRHSCKTMWYQASSHRSWSVSSHVRWMLWWLLSQNMSSMLLMCSGVSGCGGLNKGVSVIGANCHQSPKNTKL